MTPQQAEALAESLTRYYLSPVCPTCRKWSTYVGIWDEDGKTLRCHGCLKAVHRCTC